jgi:trans-2,3-dihydro-3-hydroxyanthranilate isomerase
MRTIHVKQIDAFTKIPFGGNPAGVVTEAAGLTDEMQLQIAREINASETAFVSPSTVADYKLRYFTPGVEVDMCGHATVATFFALSDEGKLDPKKEIFMIETNSGVLPVEQAQMGGDTIFRLTLPKPQLVKIDVPRAEIASLLGLKEDDLYDIPVMKVFVGIWWMVFGVKKLDKLMTAKPDLIAIEKASVRFGVGGITPFSLETLDKQYNYHLRAIAPAVGVAEDPVCGTGNGCVAAYIAHHQLIEGKDQIDLVGEQGMEVGRPGCVYVHIARQNNEINTLSIGGTAVTMLDGTVRL